MDKKCPKIVQNLSKIIHEIVQNIVLHIAQNSAKRLSKKFLKCNEVQVDILHCLSLQAKLPTGRNT